jgi:hypothetical protein
LDAHSDLVSPSSVLSDVEGFLALVDDPDSYPLVTRKGIQIDKYSKVVLL